MADFILSQKMRMFWNLWENNFAIFAMYICWEFVDFVLKILIKSTTISPWISMIRRKISFALILFTIWLTNYFLEDSNRMKKKCCQAFFLEIIFSKKKLSSKSEQKKLGKKKFKKCYCDIGYHLGFPIPVPNGNPGNPGFFLKFSEISWFF